MVKCFCAADCSSSSPTAGNVQTEWGSMGLVSCNPDRNLYYISIIISNLMAWVISSPCCIQVDHGRVGALSPILRQPGLSDPHRSLRAVPPRRNQPLGPQQILQRREAREPAALQPSGMSCPVEDGGVVRGWASTPETCCWWHTFWMRLKSDIKFP